MISLLTKLFIKDSENTRDAAVRRAYGFLCSFVGIVFNILLFIGKLIAGFISRSIAITADAFNNLSDAGSSLITLIGFKLSGQKPDPHHPYGHGRIEYISGLLVSVLILLMGFELGKTSLEKIFNPQQPEFSVLVVCILIASICIKFYMFYYNKRISKKINSAAMDATAIDSISDTLATTVVLFSMVVTHFTNVNIDGYCGVGVAIFIFVAGINSAKETISPLLGQPPEPEFVREIEEIVMSHKEISGIHDLVVHNYGPGRIMISLHAEVPANCDILKMHDAVDNVERELKSSLGCDAVIHMDPIATDDVLTKETREKVFKAIRTIDERLSIHDFRMVIGPTHTNVIFDISVPMDIKLTDIEVKNKAQTLVEICGENLYAVITVDKAVV